MAITWRNVSAPNFGAANNLLQSGSQQIGRGLRGVADQLTATGQRREDIRTQQGVGQINALENPDTIVQDRADIIAGFNPNLVNLDTLNKAGIQRRKDINSFAQADYERGQNEFELANRDEIFARGTAKFDNTIRASDQAFRLGEFDETVKEVAAGNAEELGQQKIAIGQGTLDNQDLTRQLTQIQLTDATNTQKQEEINTAVTNNVTTAYRTWASKANPTETQSLAFMQELITTARQTGAPIPPEIEQGLIDTVNNDFAQTPNQVKVETDARAIAVSNLIDSFATVDKNGNTRIKKNEFRLAGKAAGFTPDEMKTGIENFGVITGQTAKDTQAEVIRKENVENKAKLDLAVERNKSFNKNSRKPLSEAAIEGITKGLSEGLAGIGNDKQTATNALFRASFGSILTQGEVKAAYAEALEGNNFNLEKFNYAVNIFENKARVNGRKDSVGTAGLGLSDPDGISLFDQAARDRAENKRLTDENTSLKNSFGKYTNAQQDQRYDPFADNRIINGRVASGRINRGAAN